MVKDALPKFTEHEGNRKNERLQDSEFGRPESAVLQFLDDAAHALGKDRSETRVFDLGCGRGSRVAWLCGEGWDAWGADIVRGYLDAGRPYLDERGFGGDRLRLIEDSHELPFDPESFDVVLSDQVIEHVADLDAVAEGVARATRPGGWGLHVFPATFRPVEPHLRAPIVHWLPKGRVRHAAIRAAVATSLTVPYFKDLGPRAQAEIYNTFSTDETHYRLRRTVLRTFQRHGLATDLHTYSMAKLKDRIELNPRLYPLAEALYSFAMQTYVATVKTGAPKVVD